MAKNIKVSVDIFRQRWFRDLTTDFKVLWFHLLTESNFVGVFEVDSCAWNFHCHPSKPFRDDDVFVKFGGRVQCIPNHPTKAIIVGKFDYQRTYARSSAQWASAMDALADVGLDYDTLQEMRKREEDAQAPEERSTKKQQAQEQVKKDPQKATQSKFVPPTLEEVAAYCKARNSVVDPKTFHEYFTIGNWVNSNGNPVRNWKQTLVTWESHTTVKRDPAGTQALMQVNPNAEQPKREFY